jgi:hypothetical protein
MTSRSFTLLAGTALLAALALLFSGCVTTAPPAEPVTGEPGASPAAATATEGPVEQSFAIAGEYDLDSLLLPAIQMNLFGESGDYFGQFVREGDWIFPDYLFRIFRLDSGPYRQGQGTTLSSRNPEGELDYRLSRALVEDLPDGSRWWQVSQELGGQQLLYEVHMSALGTLEAIRYVDPETGERREYIPTMAQEVEQALTTMSPEELRSQIQHDAEQEVARNRQFMFDDPQILGEETVEVAAGRFPAVHVQDRRGEEGEIRADYWLSPVVPGGVLKIAYSRTDGTEEWVTELSSLSQGNRREILEVQPPGSGGSGGDQPLQSEGSPGQPVEVLIGEPYDGSVGPEGTSYYSLTVDQQSDVLIEVSDFAGEAELYSYGEDSMFEDWVSASQGSTMSAEDYLVPAGTTVYFSVADYADDYGEGERYTITASQSFILDKTGVMMRGDIYREARALESGRSYTESLGRDGLNYYKVTMKSGDVLSVQATGLSEYAGLSWFDVEGGSYSSASSSGDASGQRLEVSGLQPGAVCYFYVSGDVELVGPEERFRLTIAEE